MKIHPFQWAVVGAGPAGIAAIGKLLDQGIPQTDIIWFDPYFNVGDLGRLWRNVSSNTSVKLFKDFLHDSPSFLYHQSPVNFDINQLPPDQTCALHYVVEPLQWISDQLAIRITAEKVCIKSMVLTNRTWTLQSDTDTYYAKNVILATGALPCTLHYPGLEVVPFEVAIDKHRLANQMQPDDTYAVFGSSHSAIMIIHYLVDLGVKKIINFYRSPCRYAIDMGDWTLYDNTGLKGETARWSRQHIDGVWPNNLIRHNNNDPNILHYLPECNKVIYAVGFEPHNTIILGDYEHVRYNRHVGIIGPGLFGFGIAYPELKPDPLGHFESQVGLWKFMVYLNKIMPVWFKYHT